MHIFGKLAHIFGKLVHIFARRLVSRTSKRVSRNLGPLWQPGVYNDTNSKHKSSTLKNSHLALFEMRVRALLKWLLEGPEKQSHLERVHCKCALREGILEGV